MQGNNRRILVVSVPHPYSLTVAGNYMYWTDWERNALMRADKRTGDNVVVVRDNMPRLMDVHAVQLENVGM